MTSPRRARPAPQRWAARPGDPPAMGGGVDYIHGIEQEGARAGAATPARADGSERTWTIGRNSTGQRRGGGVSPPLSFMLKGVGL